MVLQIAITGLVATGFFWVQGEAAARSACYGGLISVVAAWMLSRGVLMAGEAAPHNPGTGTWVLYMSAALRFVLVLALFGVGLAMLGLKPVPLISGFVAAQLGYLIRFRDQPRSTGNSA
ncbi:MAG: hypothetical protein FD165_1491 [Gammaproteobacteria bacterium]|nr:MAG: hypothetical protein FD165_1491 [Gammaproteobacteria bacterium]TND02498.1 MAG: hypothetical protein FD120_2239 [Gammaproteobacteria bacterium]